MKKYFLILISIFFFYGIAGAQYKGGSYDGYASSSDSNAVVISSIKHISGTADDFRLYQNYPNPFNPVTNINFSLKKNSKVTLKIYSVTGSLIRVLLDNTGLAQGTYSVEFNASGLSSGIYFYKIETGTISDVKKMILAK